MSLPDALRGPWVAVLTGPDDMARTGPDDVTAGDLVDVSVVRRSATPVDGRVPYGYDYTDVLYASDWFSADPQDPDGDLRRHWTRAQAVAAALNGLAEPADPVRLLLDLAQARGERDAMAAEVQRLQRLLGEPPAGPGATP